MKKINKNLCIFQKPKLGKDKIEIFQFKKNLMTFIFRT